jgi:DNA-directed RNA polymerase I, II, and III subunit RPABC1
METAIKTVKEIITQRGYRITEVSDDKIIGTNSDNAQIVVFTTPVSKFNVDRVKEYISLLHKMEKNHCIVIYSECVTPMTKKLIENSVDIKIELFTLEEVQYNLTKHRLVPTHTRLSPDDAKKFKKDFGLKVGTILRTDPVARFYDFQRGDVIKLTRKSGDSYYITYRIVKG